MIGTLIAEFWPYIAGLLAFVGAALGLYGKGRKDAKAKQKAKEAKANEETHTRINNLTPVDPADDRDIIKRLRKLER